MATTTNKKLKRMLEDYLDGVLVPTSSLNLHHNYTASANTSVTSSANTGATGSTNMTNPSHLTVAMSNNPSNVSSLSESPTESFFPLNASGSSLLASEDPLTPINPMDAYLSLMAYFPEVYRRRKEAHSMVNFL